MPKKHHRIDQLVEKALADYPNTRDNDIDLQLKVIELAEGIIIHETVPVYLLRHYREDTIKRHRALLQNKFHCYEASPKVMKRRQACCKSWTSFFRNFF